MKIVSRFNDRLADKITNGVASMWCAYGFAGLAIYGFPYRNLTTAATVQWVSQEFLQLVLLSVIMVGQRVQSERLSDLHDKHDELHKAVTGRTSL
jgi:hypothetical protein